MLTDGNTVDRFLAAVAPPGMYPQFNLLFAEAKNYQRKLLICRLWR